VEKSSDANKKGKYLAEDLFHFKKNKLKAG
jgi:hypothetical protein